MSIGGSPGFNITYSQNEAYCPETNTWSVKAPMPTPRFGLSLAVSGGKIYALGGTTGSGPLTTVEVYDPATNTWQSGTVSR